MYLLPKQRNWKVSYYCHYMFVLLLVLCDCNQCLDPDVVIGNSLWFAIRLLQMFTARAAKGKDDKLDKLTPKERVSSTSDCVVDVASAFEICQCCSCPIPRPQQNLNMKHLIKSCMIRIMFSSPSKLSLSESYVRRYIWRGCVAILRHTSGCSLSVYIRAGSQIWRAGGGGMEQHMDDATRHRRLEAGQRHRFQHRNGALQAVQEYRQSLKTAGHRSFDLSNRYMYTLCWFYHGKWYLLYWYVNLRLFTIIRMGTCNVVIQFSRVYALCTHTNKGR